MPDLSGPRPVRVLRATKALSWSQLRNSRVFPGLFVDREPSGGVWRIEAKWHSAGLRLESEICNTEFICGTTRSNGKPLVGHYWAFQPLFLNL